MHDLASQIEVTFIANPLSNAGRVTVTLLGGQTIAEIVGKIAPDRAEYLSVFIAGDYIPPENWAKVRPKSGASVLIRVQPQDPVSLVSILATAFAPTITAAIGLTGFAATVAGALISMAVTYAAASLFAPRDTGSREESPTYSLSFARNSLTPFAPVPVVLGTHKMVPPYGAAPYTEIVGNDQYLRFVMIWGYGPVSLANVKIGNTPIEDYSDVEAEHDMDGTASTLGLYPSDVSQEDLAIALTTTFVSRQTAVQCNEIGVTLTFPTGLFTNSANGRKPRSVRVIGQYKLAAAGVWTAWFDETVEDDTAQVKRIAYRATALTLGQYDVQVRRFNDESDPTVNNVYDAVEWSELRSFNTTSNPINLTGIAKSAYRIKATDQLNGVVDQLNAVVSLKIPTWNGSIWTGETATSNPAAIYRYVLTGTPNKKPATNINDADLGAWYTFCQGKGLKFDQVIDFRLSVRDLLQDVANAGMASPAYVDDKWTVIIEKTRSTLVQHFTPRNTRNFTGHVLYNELPDAIRVRFFNADKDYIEDERIVYDDGYDESNATTYHVIDLPGQTDPDNVYKLARHYMAAARLRPEIFTFETDIEHLVALRGDLCRLTHDVARIGQISGRVIGKIGNTLTFDDYFTTTSGQSYTFRFRASDGSSIVKTLAASASETTNSRTFTDTTGIAVGDLFMFGDSASESLQVLITAIEYLDDIAARITCVPYSPAVYSSADTIPPYVSLISDPVSVSFIGPPTPTISRVISDETVLQVTSGGAVVPSIFVYVQPGKTSAGNGKATATEFYQARFRRSGSTDPFTYMGYTPVDSPSLMVQPVETGQSYDIDVRAIGATGTTSGWAQIAGHVVIGTSSRPPAVTTFGLNTIGDHTYVEWTYDNIPLDVTLYEIRYSPDQNTTVWSEMTTLSASVPRDARSFTVPSRSGSYAIKPIDVLGQRSTTALYINASLEDPAAMNVIQAVIAHPAFGGTKVNTERVGTNLQLTSQSFMADWATLASVTTLSYGLGFNLEGSYEFGETDLSEVYTSRITAILRLDVLSVLDWMANWQTLSAVETLSGNGSGDETSVRLEINHSIVDSPTPVYQGWRPFVIGDYTARHVKFRAILETTDISFTPVIDQMRVNIDMPDRVDTGYDIASGAGAKVITFSPYFHSLKSVSIAAQNMATGDYYSVTGKSRTGFTVTFRNSAGTAVDRTFDWQAIGYGRERAT